MLPIVSGYTVSPSNTSPVQRGKAYFGAAQATNQQPPAQIKEKSPGAWQQIKAFFSSIYKVFTNFFARVFGPKQSNATEPLTIEASSTPNQDDNKGSGTSTFDSSETSDSRIPARPASRSTCPRAEGTDEVPQESERRTTEKDASYGTDDTRAPQADSDKAEQAASVAPESELPAAKPLREITQLTQKLEDGTETHFKIFGRSEKDGGKTLEIRRGQNDEEATLYRLELQPTEKPSKYFPQGLYYQLTIKSFTAYNDFALFLIYKQAMRVAERNQAIVLAPLIFTVKDLQKEFEFEELGKRILAYNPKIPHDERQRLSNLVMISDLYHPDRKPSSKLKED